MIDSVYGLYKYYDKIAAGDFTVVTDCLYDLYRNIPANASWDPWEWYPGVFRPIDVALQAQNAAALVRTIKFAEWFIFHYVYAENDEKALRIGSTAEKLRRGLQWALDHRTAPEVRTLEVLAETYNL